MNLTLVIMAAGMGSRFGGLKQIEPVGPSGEIIADYSIYDAIKAGFNKVVFIIRKEHLDYFEEHIVSKFKDKIEVAFAFQELTEVPSDVKIPEDRVKMLGTGHALLCAKDKIDGPFAVINADDFYGSNGIKCIADYLKNNHDDREHISVNYPFIVTASKNGKVKRGISISENGYMVNNIESEITYEDGKYVARSLDGAKTFTIEENQPVSVNLFGFKYSFFDYLEKEFDEFIHGDVGLTEEILLTGILQKGIKENIFKVKVETTDSTWLGVTYKEDLPELKSKILEFVQKGEYPNNLWS